MKTKRLLMLIGSVCLSLVLAALLIPACAPAAPEEVVEEIAELEEEIADLEDEVAAEKAKTAAEKAKVSDLEDEITELRAPAEVHEWKYQTYFPRATLMGEEAFVNDIETLSDGRIKVTLFAAGELIPTGEIMRAVGAGTIELGHGSANYYPELDIGEIETGLPMAWNTSDEASLFYDDPVWRDVADEAYEELNCHYLFTTYEAPYLILTTEPVWSLDDLRPLKLRATAAFGKMFDKVGVGSVYMPIEEVYLALSTGIIDGVLYGAAYEYSMLGFNEVATYILGSSIINPVTGNTFISLDIWNELPDDLKAIVELSAYGQRYRYWSWVVAEDLTAKARDYVVTSLPSEDLATLTEAALDVWDEQSAKSARCAQAVELLKELNRSLGRLK